ncbi:phytosulfokines-like [Mercurialis annua]|uniref:phytosulfokines-like n=1 Tax=Mercurialis annua TaxID=3986 RepID=UPI00215E1E64|nr:phytosulfokines-like [Mercurialis annua]
MAKKLSFLTLVILLVLSSGESRILLSTTTTIAKQQIPFSFSSSSSTDGLSTNKDDGCAGLGSEECVIRRFLDVHTDYIYTQDITP